MADASQTNVAFQALRLLLRNGRDMVPKGCEKVLYFIFHERAHFKVLHGFAYDGDGSTRSISSLAPLRAGPARPQKNGKIEPDFGTPSSSPCYQSLITEISLSSRCIGNGIGFPINVVEDLSLQLRNASIIA
jgi:hypothetical protein